MSKNIVTPRGSTLSRRDFLKLGGTALGGLVLAGCTPSAAPVAAPVVPVTGLKSKIDTLHLGYDNPNWSHQVTDYVAREKGWFKDYGLTNVDCIVFDDALPPIIGGGVQFTAADTQPVMEANLNQSVDVWYLGTRRGKEDMLFGLAPGVTLESLKGSGKEVSGGKVGSRNELLGKMMLKELGVDPEKDVTWITIGGGSDTRLAALMNGGLAGGCIQVRHIKTLQDAGGTVVYRKTRTIAQDGYITMGSMIKTNPDTVTAFLAATIKAKQYIARPDTKDEVIAIMEKNGFAFSQEFKDTYIDGIQILSTDGGFDIPDMDNYWNELAQTGEGAANFSWRKAMNLDFLWKAQELNGLPRRPAKL